MASGYLDCIYSVFSGKLHVLVLGRTIVPLVCHDRSDPITKEVGQEDPGPKEVGLIHYGLLRCCIFIWSPRLQVQIHRSLCSTCLVVVKYGPSIFVPPTLIVVTTKRVKVHLWLNMVNTWMSIDLTFCSSSFLLLWPVELHPQGLII